MRARRRLDISRVLRNAASRSTPDLEHREIGRLASEGTFMAMTMTGEVTLPAGRPKVWALLNDPEVLKSAIPGCQSLEKTGDNGFAAVVKTKIGPVSATFKGKVELSDIVPLVGSTIKGEDGGGSAG